MMVRWEVFKLLRQRRTFLGLGAAALVPLVLLAAVEIIRSGPEAGEAPFAAQLLGNGLVIPLATLAFGSVVLLPLLTVLVAGDAVAGEVSGGTLKMILGREWGARGCSGRRPRRWGSTPWPWLGRSSGWGWWPGGWPSDSGRLRVSVSPRLVPRGGGTSELASVPLTRAIDPCPPSVG